MNVFGVELPGTRYLNPWTRRTRMERTQVIGYYNAMNIQK